MPKFNNEFGEVEFTQLAGCSAVVISHAMQIYPQWRGKGKSRENLKLRMERARSMGYAIMIATVRQDNAAEIKILSTTEGWVPVHYFNNPKTGAALVLWVCNV